MGPARNDDHPDEGTIHAWLDGAFDAPTAEAIEAHVASCPSCTARVAEARGLIAGASRVVSALDDVPSGATPAWGRAPGAGSASPSHSRATWRRLRVTPKRAAIAATILVALGVTLTRQRIAPEAELAKSNVAATSAAPVRPHDELLDSAVKQNVEAANPPRAIQAAPAPKVAVPFATGRADVVADTTARSRVAVARGAIRAQTDSQRVLADRAGVGSAVAGAAPVPSEAERREMAASRKAEALTQRVPAYRAVPSSPAAAECYRVESANGTPATWGTVPLPFVVALDTVGGSRLARVNAADGSSNSRAIWSRSGDDSLTFQLRRIGYTATLTLGGAGDVRPGVMRSAPVQQQLSEAVVTGAAPESSRGAGGRSVARRRAASIPAPSSAPAASAPQETAGTPATAVVARRVSCQS